MTLTERLPVILKLGSAQVVAWGSSYYLTAILGDPIAESLGVSSNWVFGCFSVSLLLMSAAGPAIGRTIDRLGGRWVLAASNLSLAAGLVTLGFCRSLEMLGIAWIFLGAGMGLGLYESAFATLGRIYGAAARPSITGITLLGGLASTVAWPLTAWGLSHVGWRETCFAWAAVNLAIGLPLNLSLPRAAVAASSHDDAKPHVPMDRDMWLLAGCFAMVWMIASGMAAHLPRLLESAGATASQAIVAGALFGPAQVVARLFEALVLNRAHPLLAARLATLAHPAGALLLGLLGVWAGFGGPAAVIFAVCHGAGNGILTIARGAVPLALYGPLDYGYRLGLLGAPARIAQAAAPLTFGLLLEFWGARAFAVSAGLGLAAFGCLVLVGNKQGR